MKMAWASKLAVFSLLVTWVQCLPFHVDDINQRWLALESNMVEDPEVISDKRKRFDEYYRSEPEHQQGMKSCHSPSDNICNNILKK